MSNSIKNKLLSIIQVIIGVGILAFIFRHISDKKDMLDALATVAERWQFLLAGISCYGICLLLVSIRWKILLNTQKLNVPFARVVMLYFVGQFFNSFMFGSTGGDVVKAYFVTKETPGKKTAAVATVLIDRVIGLLALIPLTMIVMLFRIDFFLSDPKLKTALWFNTLLLVAAIAGLFVVFRKNLLEHWSFFRNLENKTSLGAIIGKVYNSFHICISNFSVLSVTFIISLINHTFILFMCLLLAKALNISLTFIDGVSLFLIINAVGALPITPSGLGTRDAAAIYLLGVVGVLPSRALILSLLIYATMLVWSVIGGIVYFLYIFRPAKTAGQDKIILKDINP